MCGWALKPKPSRGAQPRHHRSMGERAILARLTWICPWAKSTASQRYVTSPTGRKPSRQATSTMVASRWTVAIGPGGFDDPVDLSVGQVFARPLSW
jgi:hypothetical protein